jgi:hypothetical protein
VLEEDHRSRLTGLHLGVLDSEDVEDVSILSGDAVAFSGKPVFLSNLFPTHRRFFGLGTVGGA